MKPFDAGYVLAAWPTMEPQSDFADRVLAAYDAPPVVAKRRWPLYACALAVLALFSPLLGSPRHTPPNSAPVLVAHGPDADLDLGLGRQTD